MICLVQIYLTNQWASVRDTSIKVSLHGVKSYCGEFHKSEIRVLSKNIEIGTFIPKLLASKLTKYAKKGIKDMAK